MPTAKPRPLMLKLVGEPFMILAPRSFALTDDGQGWRDLARGPISETGSLRVQVARILPHIGCSGIDGTILLHDMEKRRDVLGGLCHGAGLLEAAASIPDEVLQTNGYFVFPHNVKAMKNDENERAILTLFRVPNVPNMPAHGWLDRWNFLERGFSERAHILLHA